MQNAKRKTRNAKLQGKIETVEKGEFWPVSSRTEATASTRDLGDRYCKRAVKVVLQQSQIKNFGFCVYFVIWILSFVILTSGCARIIEGVRCVGGVSTKALENGRKNAVKKTFNYDYPAAFAKVKEALKNKGSYIYSQSLKKHMIAVYYSKDDATGVGIFFTEVDPQTTQVEVSSSSTFARESLARKIFNALEGIVSDDTQESGEINAQMQIGG